MKLFRVSDGRPIPRPKGTTEPPRSAGSEKRHQARVKEELGLAFDASEQVEDYPLAGVSALSSGKSEVFKSMLRDSAEEVRRGLTSRQPGQEPAEGSA